LIAELPFIVPIVVVVAVVIVVVVVIIVLLLLILYVVAVCESLTKFQVIYLFQKFHQFHFHFKAAKTQGAFKLRLGLVKAMD